MKNNKWFVPVKVSRKEKKQLFAFHHAAASAAIFYSWREHLNEYTTLYAVELPGRATRSREEAIGDINTITKSIAEVIGPYLGEIPTFFFGHSMGGILAYETASLLSNLGHSIDHFIASAVSPPGYRQITNPIHNLNDDMFKKELIKYGGIPASLIENVDFWDIFLPIARTDFTMIANYTSPQKVIPLNCEITAIVGRNDNIVKAEKAKYWEKFTKSNFKLIEINGGHLFIREKNNMLEIINNILLKPIEN